MLVNASPVSIAMNPPSSTPALLRGASSHPDPEAAVAEFHAQVAHPGVEVVVFFCATAYALDRIAAAMRAAFAGITVIGTTTAAEIGPEGYTSSSLCGFSLAGPDFQVAVGALTALDGFTPEAGAATTTRLLRELSRTGPLPTGDNTFGFLMIDGTALREERVAHGLHSGLGDIPMFGGSAGDGLDVGRETRVFHDGEFHADHAVLMLVRTTRRFKVFKTQNYEPTDTKMVITEADPRTRTVREINGDLAAREYARLTGIPPDQLDFNTFARYPVGVVRRGQYYPRSIGWANPDHSLTFACAVDVGVVLSLARATGYVETLAAQLAAVRAEVGDPALLIACDCVFRYHEMRREGLIDQVGNLMRDHQAVGFSTYGEQFNAMHVNLSLTGVAIGR